MVRVRLFAVPSTFQLRLCHVPEVAALDPVIQREKAIIKVDALFVMRSKVALIIFFI
jgi:hypothetical protein